MTDVANVTVTEGAERAVEDGRKGGQKRPRKKKNIGKQLKDV